VPVVRDFAEGVDDHGIVGILSGRVGDKGMGKIVVIGP
jgi:hypothetical protein